MFNWFCFEQKNSGNTDILYTTTIVTNSDFNTVAVRFNDGVVSPQTEKSDHFIVVEKVSDTSFYAYCENEMYGNLLIRALVNFPIDYYMKKSAE